MPLEPLSDGGGALEAAGSIDDAHPSAVSVHTDDDSSGEHIVYRPAGDGPPLGGLVDVVAAEAASRDAALAAQKADATAASSAATQSQPPAIDPAVTQAAAANDPSQLPPPVIPGPDGVPRPPSAYPVPTLPPDPRYHEKPELAYAHSIAMRMVALTPPTPAGSPIVFPTFPQEFLNSATMEMKEEAAKAFIAAKMSLTMAFMDEVIQQERADIQVQIILNQLAMAIHSMPLHVVFPQPGQPPHRPQPRQSYPRTSYRQPDPPQPILWQPFMPQPIPQPIPPPVSQPIPQPPAAAAQQQSEPPPPQRQGPLLHLPPRALKQEQEDQQAQQQPRRQQAPKQRSMPRVRTPNPFDDDEDGDYVPNYRDDDSDFISSSASAPEDNVSDYAVTRKQGAKKSAKNVNTRPKRTPSTKKKAPIRPSPASAPQRAKRARALSGGDELLADNRAVIAQGLQNQLEQQEHLRANAKLGTSAIMMPIESAVGPRGVRLVEVFSPFIGRVVPMYQASRDPHQNRLLFRQASVRHRNNQQTTHRPYKTFIAESRNTECGVIQASHYAFATGSRGMSKLRLNDHFFSTFAIERYEAHQMTRRLHANNLKSDSVANAHESGDRELEARLMKVDAMEFLLESESKKAALARDGPEPMLSRYHVYQLIDNKPRGHAIPTEDFPVDLVMHTDDYGVRTPLGVRDGDAAIQRYLEVRFEKVMSLRAEAGDDAIPPFSQDGYTYAFAHPIIVQGIAAVAIATSDQPRPSVFNDAGGVHGVRRSPPNQLQAVTTVAVAASSQSRPQPPVSPDVAPMSISSKSSSSSSSRPSPPRPAQSAPAAAAAAASYSYGFQSSDLRLRQPRKPISEARAAEWERNYSQQGIPVPLPPAPTLVVPIMNQLSIAEQFTQQQEVAVVQAQLHQQQLAAAQVQFLHQQQLAAQVQYQQQLVAQVQAQQFAAQARFEQRQQHQVLAAAGYDRNSYADVLEQQQAAYLKYTTQARPGNSNATTSAASAQPYWYDPSQGSTTKERTRRARRGRVGRTPASVTQQRRNNQAHNQARDEAEQARQLVLEERQNAQNAQHSPPPPAASAPATVWPPNASRAGQTQQEQYEYLKRLLAAPPTPTTEFVYRRGFHSLEDAPPMPVTHRQNTGATSAQRSSSHRSPPPPPPPAAAAPAVSYSAPPITSRDAGASRDSAIVLLGDEIREHNPDDHHETEIYE